MPAWIRGRGSLLLAVTLLAFGVVFALVWQGQRARSWNVLLVTFDTTRADHIGSYGNSRIQTPTLDGLAASGLRFANAYTAVPITAPSHSTILTGRYPISHGVRDNGLFVLGKDQETLAEILHDHGYATGAAVGSFPITAHFGLNQGFDFFDDHLTGKNENYLGELAKSKERMFFDERRAAQVNEALLPWLREHSARPFFAWVHYFDAHQPFEPPPPYDQLYADDLYDGEIAYADSSLGFLINQLRDMGVLDNTLIVMVADHGEGLSEHNEVTHAVLAYNSTLHVPLIIRPPAGVVAPGTVVEERVGTVDIVPTVLDLLGIPAPDNLQGRSLRSAWQAGGTPGGAPLQYAENLSPHLAHGWGELRVLFDGNLKYIHGPRPELFDLALDPQESHNLVADRPDQARQLRDELSLFLEKHAVAGVSTTEHLSDQDRQRLESLGYLHSSGGGGETVGETLQDGGIAPQDKVGMLNDLSSAKHLIYKGRFEDALPYTKRLIAASPDSPMFLELHATALLGAGQIDDAWDIEQRLRETGGVSAQLMFQLSMRRFQQGREEEAIDTLERYLDSSPNAPGAWLLASFQRKRGEIEKSRQTLQSALATDPKFVPARIDLAISFAETGDSAAADDEFVRAISDGAYEAEAWYNYGTFTLKEGRYAEAERLFQRAVEISPDYLKGYLGLVATHVASGDEKAARDTVAALRKRAPDSKEAKAAENMVSVPQDS
jgi:arylsulfatase A-like enzyme/Tfp pilus assembly protein PilF